MTGKEVESEASTEREEAVPAVLRLGDEPDGWEDTAGRSIKRDAPDTGKGRPRDRGASVEVEVHEEGMEQRYRFDSLALA